MRFIVIFWSIFTTIITGVIAPVVFYFHRYIELSYWRVMPMAILGDGTKYLLWTKTITIILYPIFILLLLFSAVAKGIDTQWCLLMLWFAGIISLMMTIYDILRQCYLCMGVTRKFAIKAFLKNFSFFLGLFYASARSCFGADVQAQANLCTKF